MKNSFFYNFRTGCFQFEVTNMLTCVTKVRFRYVDFSCEIDVCLHHANLAYADEYICTNMLTCVTNVRFRYVDFSCEIDVCLHHANLAYADEYICTNMLTCVTNVRFRYVDFSYGETGASWHTG